MRGVLLPPFQLSLDVVPGKALRIRKQRGWRREVTTKFWKGEPVEGLEMLVFFGGWASQSSFSSAVVEIEGSDIVYVSRQKRKPESVATRDEGGMGIGRPGFDERMKRR